MKNLTKAIALAGVMTTGLTGAQLAQAEVDVSASASVASMYLWRGQDLGRDNGVPAVSGDISVSTGGAYATMWTSSGDQKYGNEYDFGVGYGGEMEGFSYDVSAWTYIYPSDATGDGSSNSFDLSELIVSLGYEGASFSYYYPLAGDGNDDYSYMTLGYGMGAYSATVGISDDNEDNKGNIYTHLDLSYAYNDSLAFTVSKVVSAELDETEDDTKFVVSYSLPIDM